MTRALKAARVTSDLVTFDFCGPKVANQGFKPMVREGTFDAGELAIGTFLQAKVYGKPLVLLPAVVMGRSQHHTIVYNHAKGELGPKDLEGRRVGVRSYTQTTGIWVRGILQHEYGVDLEQGDLGVHRRRAPGRIPAIRRIVERPPPGRQEARPDAARRRARRRASPAATSRTTRASAP